MKAYLVVDVDYDSHEILAAYFDKDKAVERMIIEIRELYFYKQQLWPGRFDVSPKYSETIDITEIDID